MKTARAGSKSLGYLPTEILCKIKKPIKGNKLSSL